MRQNQSYQPNSFNYINSISPFNSSKYQQQLYQDPSRLSLSQQSQNSQYSTNSFLTPQKNNKQQDQVIQNKQELEETIKILEEKYNNLQKSFEDQFLNNEQKVNDCADQQQSLQSLLESYLKKNDISLELKQTEMEKQQKKFESEVKQFQDLTANQQNQIQEIQQNVATSQEEQKKISGKIKKDVKTFSESVTKEMGLVQEIQALQQQQLLQVQQKIEISEQEQKQNKETLNEEIKNCSEQVNKEINLVQNEQVQQQHSISQIQEQQLAIQEEVKQNQNKLAEEIQKMNSDIECMKKNKSIDYRTIIQYVLTIAGISSQLAMKLLNKNRNLILLIALFFIGLHFGYQHALVMLKYLKRKINGFFRF